MPLPSKPVALITGGSRGIGLGIAKCLAQAGFDLAINGRRSAEEVAPALHELDGLGAQTLYLPADVAALAEHPHLLAAIKDRFGRLDSLVNNAGIAPEVRADILEATPESFDRLISINLKGPYFLTQAAAKWMIEQKQSQPQYFGTIVNVSSISAQVASVNRGDYCISKAGVAMASQLWATRLGEFGIGVYEIRPGIIRSDMTAAVKDKYDKLLAEGLTLENRWGEPEDVGRAVAAIATGNIRYATGAVIPIDGGLTVKRL